MPSNQKVVPSSPNSSIISSCTVHGEHGLEGIALSTFKLKPKGACATINTLVENDSLSSYSLPEEIKHGAKLRTGKKASIGGSRDSSENGQCDTATLSSKTHAIIDIGDHAEPVQELTYVMAYLQLMYWTCISPFNPTKNLDGARTGSWIDLMLNVVQKICFTVITSLSIAQSFFEIKYTMLYNLSEPGLENFTDMSFYAMNGATKIFYVYLFMLQQWRFLKMFSGLTKLRAFPMQKSSKNITCRSYMMHAIALGTASLLLSLIHTIFGVGIFGWTPEKFVLHHSKSYGYAVSIWTTQDIEDDTLFKSIVENYGTVLTPTTCILGIFRMLMLFFSNIQMDHVTNLMLCNAETLKQEMKLIEKKISDPKNDVENITLREFLDNGGDWAHFQLLKKTVNDNNDSMDALMKYKHVNNLMMFVYFVMNAFDFDFSLAYSLRLVYNILEVSYTYRIATQASSLNDSMRKWIRRLAWKSTDKPFRDNVPLIIDELKQEPIGMGKGQFRIDESFLYRFIGSVGSVFVLQAQSREAATE